MRLRTYVAHQLILTVPVVLGLITVLFGAYNALGTQQKLVAAFGAAPNSEPWLYNPTLSPGQGSCPGPNLSSPPALTACANPVYERGVAALGLDQPVPVQWAIYVGRSLTLQWGVVNNESAVGNVNPALRDLPATTVLAGALPYSLELSAISIAMAYPLAAALAASAVRSRRASADPALRIVSFTRFLLPVFLLAGLVLMGVVLVVGSRGGYAATTPWCPAGMPTYSEFTGSWPPGYCFGNSLPSWMNGGVHTSPTGVPFVDALVAGEGWVALDSLGRMVVPALLVASSAGLALAVAARYRLDCETVHRVVLGARAVGLSEAAVRDRVVRASVRRAVVGRLESVMGTFVLALIVVEVAFRLNGVGALSVESVAAGSGPPDTALVFGGLLVLAYFVLGIRFAARVTEAYLDRRLLSRGLQYSDRPWLVPVGQDETPGPRSVTPGPKP